ncbi:hypothetical protein PCANC_18850 [Puccinia coronata f. sp. avenae]|uniref:Uncharacterized protein n=1 Tax=Puccinia coronata f. sp. avenae TaxID=200324 RepID=A0A2N5U8P9_9BASI|nr:hypothetical protein PCASD_13478 [Puccinia coronata f. sp. avenae]PLW34038.1 hypothetical protein PCANC_18850 [Puccinia coronata f. sp. avenae]
MNGTRWSELNRLPYWDPVRNVALGVMHNWYEGVLQHHWRVRWAFEPEQPKNFTHDDQLDDWEDDNSSSSETSLNFHDNALVHIRKALPDIVVPRNSTTNADSTKFKEAYLLYTETSKVVFDSPKIVPNHHYVLHIPAQMRWWGSLSNVSEFAGERINGMLQKMKTNGIIGEIKGTVLREFCQTQRLNSQAPRWSLQLVNHQPKSETARLVEVHPDVYMALLQKLQGEDSTLQNYKDVPHPDGASVLTPYANELKSFESKGGLYISKTRQNCLPEFNV